jgi:hypothetical protein
MRVTVLDPRVSAEYCLYLNRKFPEFEEFYVMQAVYPSNIRFPGKRRLGAAYTC